MIYFIIFVLLAWVWLLSEWINAPLHNNTYNNDSTTQSNDTNNQEI